MPQFMKDDAPEHGQDQGHAGQNALQIGSSRRENHHDPHDENGERPMDLNEDSPDVGDLERPLHGGNVSPHTNKNPQCPPVHRG